MQMMLSLKADHYAEIWAQLQPVPPDAVLNSSGDINTTWETKQWVEEQRNKQPKVQYFIFV